MSSSDGDLREKVEEWLKTEGYPLEFAVASSFRRHRFHVRQGAYVRSREDDSPPREIDVEAWRDLKTSPGLVRAEFVVECKWSGDQPWVLFTSEKHGMSPAACASQAISSDAGAAILWSVAGSDMVSRSPLFTELERTGFGGVVARFKGSGDRRDKVYGALQSVVEKAVLRAKSYDSRGDALRLEIGYVAFPVVVVDTPLFEAYWHADKGQVVVEEASHVRLHWKGASSWPFIATVDVVRAAALDEFLTGRASAIKTMLNLLGERYRQVADCIAQRKLERLTIDHGSRGFLGLPRLLAQIARSAPGG